MGFTEIPNQVNAIRKLCRSHAMLVRLHTLKEWVSAGEAIWPDTRLILPTLREHLIFSENANGELGSKMHAIRIDHCIRRLGKSVKPVLCSLSDSHIPLIKRKLVDRIDTETSHAECSLHRRKILKSGANDAVR